MYASYLIETDGNTPIDTYTTLDEALHDIRHSWNEDPEGAQAFMITLHGSPVAFLVRQEGDPEVCLTTYVSGTTERHRCVYVYGADGSYESTTITDETTLAVA